MARYQAFSLAVAAVALTFAGASPASADPGAKKIPCSMVFPEGDVTGDVVLTPSGNVNFNCNFGEGSFGGPAQHFDCADFGWGTGQIIIPPSGHTQAHCSNFPVP
jgi:hypothetical protein